MATKTYEVKISQNPSFQTVTGLTNKTWDSENITTGRAVSEDQLLAAINEVQGSIESDTNTVTTVAGANGVSVTDADTDGNHAYTVGLGNEVTVGSTESGSTDNPILIDGGDGVISGLTNTTWDTTNVTSGQAATEDQLLAAINGVNSAHSSVAAGTGIDSVTTATDSTSGAITYTINATEYEVVSGDDNIIVTLRGASTGD